MVFGPSAAKKSFLVYDLACCIATGKDWHGNRVKQGAVLIICGEGHGGLNRRLKDCEKYNQQSQTSYKLSQHSILHNSND